MNDCREEQQGFCYFHPKEDVVGVCAVCLYERLQILAAKQDHGHLSSSRGRRILQGSCHASSHHRRPSINLQKILAFGGLFNKHWKSGNDSYDLTTSSQEDSFISIKFEGDGVASWGTSTEPSSCKQNLNSRKEPSKEKDASKDSLTVVDHVKSRSLLRWRKRIGYLFQFTRWKKSCHVNARRGWIRSRSKRKCKE